MLIVRPTAIRFDVDRLRADIDRVAAMCPFYETTNQISLCHRPESSGADPVARFRDGVGHMRTTGAKGEADFSVLHELVRDSYLGEVYRTVRARYPDAHGRYRIRRLRPRTCLPWHCDDGPKYHIPIRTNDDAFFVTRAGIYRMTDEGRLHVVRTDIYHTAMNGGREDRVVLAIDGVPDWGRLAVGVRRILKRASR